MPKHCITPAARRAGAEASRARANQKAAELASVIAELWAAGTTSLSGIAAALNARGVRIAVGPSSLVCVTGRELVGAAGGLRWWS
jgi:hypothetical protein